MELRNANAGTVKCITEEAKPGTIIDAQNTLSIMGDEKVVRHRERH